MLVSLDKNKWLYDWMHDNWNKDIQNIIFNEEFKVYRPNEMREKIHGLLLAKGYKAKLTRKFDIIISMSEAQYVYLKLKYI